MSWLTTPTCSIRESIYEASKVRHKYCEKGAWRVSHPLPSLLLTPTGESIY